MGITDFLGNWYFYRQLDKPLDSKDVEIGE